MKYTGSIEYIIKQTLKNKQKQQQTDIFYFIPVFDILSKAVKPFIHTVENILLKTVSKHTLKIYTKVSSKYVWPFFNIMHERVNKSSAILESLTTLSESTFRLIL